jgi:FkbM family methyltransferase
MTPSGIIQTPEGWYVLEKDSHLSRWVEQNKRLWNEDLSNLKPYIPEGGTVVDAGASLGDHSFTYAEYVGKAGRVVAFEPNPLAFQCLFRNMEAFPWVDCINKGLSDFDGSAAFVPNENAGASFIAPPNTSPGPSAVVVPIGRLDDHIALMRGRCDFIHLDVEGFEPRALAGAERTIGTFKPTMLIEVKRGCLRRQNFTQEDIYSVLRAYGYDWREMPGCDGSEEQRDILATPRK